MPTPSLSRRRFLQTTLAAGTAFTVAPTFGAFSSNPSKSVRLGAPVFGAPADPDGLAKAHRDLGYRAAYCPNIDLADKERIRDTEAAFEKHDVVIAEVGRWVNLMDSDPEKRKQNHAFVTEGLALAEAVGARCCVDIAGSFNEEVWYGPHPKNFSQEFFDAAVENARKIIDAVKPKRTKFAYEMMGWARPDSADSYLALLKAIDRPGFAVHLDPCNAINCPERFYDNTALLNECFDKLGPHIASCHAKDLSWEVEMNVHFREVVLGTGCLDYKTFLARLAALPGEVPLMIEHMKDKEEYDRSREYVFKVASMYSR